MAAGSNMHAGATAMHLWLLALARLSYLHRPSDVLNSPWLARKVHFRAEVDRLKVI
jgi:hypothetical protein